MNTRSSISINPTHHKPQYVSALSATIRSNPANAASATLLKIFLICGLSPHRIGKAQG